MNLTLRFSDPGSDTKALVGGKGANLGLCAQQGFPVPPGFTVTTDAYAVFLTETGLQATIENLLDGADYADAPDLERRTAAIRDAVVATPLPDALATAISEGYAALGGEPFVAVRSSGTAEDLAEASFAGLHDTFLHIHGQAGVVDAVHWCWASLWTARAAAYREKQGLNDVAAIRMAVVVQVMIDAEVSGVMFTANPITTATDELVINASWGLGEAVVQGFVTPDEYVVKAHRPVAIGFDQRPTPANAAITLRVKRTTTGSKELRMVRDPETGHGTITETVPADQQSRLTLSDAQAVELAELGRRVQAFYEDMPQDIEWALAGGAFFLLQARPITGVDFDWAADMESFQWAPDDENALWTGRFSELLTGAKSPLYYHWVSDADSAGYYAIGNTLGIPELMGPAYTSGGLDVNRPARHQLHKYHRAEVYLNTEFEKVMTAKTFLPWLRTPEISQWLSPEQAEEVHATPFSYKDFVTSFARLQLVQPDSGLFGVLDRTQEFIDTAADKSKPAELPDFATLSDAQLKARLNEQWLVPAVYTGYSMILWFIYTPQMFSLFGRLINQWYTGDNPNAFAELCQGVDVRSKTLEENLGLFELAEEISSSAELSALFEQHKNGDFFGALENSEVGRIFLQHYREFARVHGHRGHEDRDFGYPRRFEDPSIDIRSFQLLLARDNPVSPYAVEQQLTARREAVFEDVMRNVRRGGLTGILKAEAIKIVYTWVQRFLAIRDDERWAYEQSSFCAKLYCREIGRRATERGILEDPEDFLMFTKDELFDMLDSRAGVKLTRAKAAARRRDYNRALERTHEFPAYMRDGREVAVAGADGHAGLIGTGWTSGTVTATARVVNRLSEVHRVKQGDILVCQSTDPGWTPVFMLLSGIVIETGGVLAHAVCLSREYGLPAVQLPTARKQIPDGATITINGSTGEIVIADEIGDAADKIGSDSDQSWAALNGVLAG
jgi:phosphohistidine swiveling domain-containing protein